MEDISLHILDIAENSITAGATRVMIRISEDTAGDVFSVEVKDNGRGIPEEHLKEVLDPFYTTRTTRKIGLGLSLLAQSARETGGDISIRSSESSGTVVTADFRPSHIDMKPLGNIADTMLVLIAGNPRVDFVFSFVKNGRDHSIDTRRIKKELRGMPINSPPGLSLMRNCLDEILTAAEKDVK